MAPGGVPAEDDRGGEIAVNPLDAAAYLRHHLGQRNAGEQCEIERHVGGPGPYDGLGCERVLTLGLALPGAAVDEHQRHLSVAVDVECLDRGGTIALGARLADPRANRVARHAEPLDDLVRVRHPGALLVLLVERLLVVVEEDLLQKRTAMPSSSPSEFTRSTRL